MRKIYIIIVVCFLVLLASCGADMDDSMNPNIDGMSFDYYKSYELNGISYEVYIPNNEEEAFYFKHEEGNISSKSSTWTINFVYNPNYLVSELNETDEVWSSLFSVLESEEQSLERKYESDLAFFDPYSSVELEFILENQEQIEVSYVIFYTYLPIRLYNTDTKKRTTIGVPVSVTVLKKANGMIDNPFENEIMLWEDFLAIENLQ